jgi:hypothetical protein
MKIQVQKIKQGTFQGQIKISDGEGGFLLLTKEQAKSLIDVLIAATRD